VLPWAEVFSLDVNPGKLPQWLAPAPMKNGKNESGRLGLKLNVQDD